MSFTVADELGKYGSRRIYFDPLAGNHGDTLIQMGSRRALGQADVRLVSRPEDAEVLVMNGGGGLNRVHPDGFARLAHYSNHYPLKPLIVLPSSIEVDAVDFDALLANRQAALTLFARERFTYEQLQGIKATCPMTISIDHDMAFWLETDAYVKALREHLDTRHVLVVERGDQENADLAHAGPPRRSRVAWVPKGLKQPLKRYLARKHATDPRRLTPFATRSLERVRQAHPSLADHPVYAADVSRADVCSFADFGLLIAQARVVITMRLHVAILAAMLGKPVFLKQGSYHKFLGVYEYSLQPRGVEFIE